MQAAVELGGDVEVIQGAAGGETADESALDAGDGGDAQVGDGPAFEDGFAGGVSGEGGDVERLRG